MELIDLLHKYEENDKNKIIKYIRELINYTIVEKNNNSQFPEEIKVKNTILIYEFCISLEKITKKRINTQDLLKLLPGKIMVQDLSENITKARKQLYQYLMEIIELNLIQSEELSLDQVIHQVRDIIYVNSYINEEPDIKTFNEYTRKTKSMLKTTDYILFKGLYNYEFNPEKSIYKIYNKNVEDRNERMADIWEMALEKLNIKNIDKSYDIPLKEESEKNIEKYFLKNCIKKSIAVNFFGSIDKRKINVDNALVLLKNIRKQYPEFEINILDSPVDREKIFEILKEEKIGGIYYYKDTNSIFDAISIIKRSEIVVSPDTSIVHIAEGFDKKIIAFYEKKEIEKRRYAINEKNKIVVYENEINNLNYDLINYSI